MYDPQTGVYITSEESFPNQGLYQKDSAYYLKFNSSKGLYAIKQLKAQYEGIESNRCFYYHVYLDLLFEAIGLIIVRFKPARSAKKIIRQQADDNCKEYDYTMEYYPLLHDKSFRNFIEHIDEKGHMLIEKHKYWGTFNLIYPNMKEKVRNDLLDSHKPQNNLLNIENMTYTILDYDKKTDSIKTKIINILELEKELQQIQKISSRIWSFLTELF